MIDLRYYNERRPQKNLMASMPPCPICGAKAFLTHDVVDGLDFGYSVGCPRYCNRDGIHGHDENTPDADRLTIFCCASAQDAASKWAARVEMVRQSSSNGGAMGRQTRERGIKEEGEK